MAEGRPRRGNRAEPGAKRRRRGSVMVELPRNVIAKRLASKKVAFYYNVPTRYRKLNCTVSNEPLGTDYALACERAVTLNGLFDEWDATRKGLPVSGSNEPKIGSVD